MKQENISISLDLTPLFLWTIYCVTWTCLDRSESCLLPRDVLQIWLWNKNSDFFYIHGMRLQYMYSQNILHIPCVDSKEVNIVIIKRR